MKSHHHLFLTILSLTALLPPTLSLLAADRAALLRLRSAVRGRTLLWDTAAASPCTSWRGVTCDNTSTRVLELRLPGDGLSGQIPANTVSNLTDLRALSLRENSLSGEIPSDIGACMHLVDVHLQGNEFSGDIPTGFFGLINLARVNLGRNNLTGSLSNRFDDLINLRTLYLENNQFTGSLPDLDSLIGLRDFNVSFNRLTGSVPSSLSNFSPQSFLGNSLCGGTLVDCPDNGGNNLSNGAIVGIALGSSIVLVLILVVLFVSWRKYRSPKILPRSIRSPIGRGEVWSRNPSLVVDGKGLSDNSFSSEKRKIGEGFRDVIKNVGSDGLVFFGENVEVFSLTELLSSSAEVLGKGVIGSTYKAYFESGVEVIVKRLKKVCVSEEEFRGEIEEVGSLVHENLEPLRGYFYGREEKLLLYEPMSNGSLSSLLHGNDKQPLMSFEIRAKIALGVASAIDYLHSVSPTTTHGNIKSSNIFLTDYYKPRVSEFGLTRLVSSMANLNGYRAPEVTNTRSISQQADVYSFGVVLLELMTGKEPDYVLKDEGIELPNWVRSVVKENWTSEVLDPELIRYEDFDEEKMVRLLQIAIDCTDRQPDMRPSMVEVIRCMKEICDWNLKKFNVV